MLHESILSVSGIILLAFLAGLLAHIIYLYWQGDMTDLGKSGQSPEQEIQLLQQYTTLKDQYVQLQAECERYIKQMKDNERQISVAIQKTGMSKNFLHDIDKSVDAIINQLDDLKRVPIENAGQQKAVQEICTRMRRTIDIVGDHIRDMKRFIEEYGQDIPVNRSRCNLIRLCEEVRDLRVESAAQQQIELAVVAPNSLPTVIIDKDQIRRVLTNLVDNGINYANFEANQRGSQKPHVLVELFLEQSTHEKIVVKVRDNGVGMSPELVDAFNHGIPLNVDQQKLHIRGSGLGLEIVKLYINAHKKVGINIEISVTSVVGRGSIFTINFPLEQNT